MGVQRGQAHSDDLLRGKAINSLTEADRNLATTLVLGVIRWQIRLDEQFRALLARPKAKLDPEVLIALRLGAFQILHLDRIPPRAAIDESVELTKQAGHQFASGMVNAVLRKLVSAPRPLYSDETPEGLALAEGHPAWLVERWAANFGLEAARAICRHGQTQPVLSVRLTGPKVEEELLKAGIVLDPGEMLTDARTVTSGDVTPTPAFLAGRVRIQDEGSQLVSELAAADLGPSVRRILDACAAPGGKTLILAERHPEAHILACEISEPRLEQLKKRLAPLGDRVECRLGDVATVTEENAFDLVLADVPCSGTGTLGRNPEIRHRLQPEELPRQAERQRAILAAALRAVRPGGSVVYSTCSMEPEENEQVVSAVLAETPNARLISLDSSLKSLLTAGRLTADAAQRLQAALTAEGCLRLLPVAFQTDGFFVARIEKT